MLPKPFLVTSVLGLASLVAGIPRPFGRPCSQERPCAAPEICIPINSSCRNLRRCPGRCIIEEPIPLPPVGPIAPIWTHPSPATFTLDPATPIIDDPIVLTTPPPEPDSVPILDPVLEPFTIDDPVDDTVIGPVISSGPSIQSEPWAEPLADPIPTPEIDLPFPDPIMDPVDWPLDTLIPFPDPVIDPVDWPIDTILPFPDPAIDPPDWLIDTIPSFPDPTINLPDFPINTALPFPDTELEPIPLEPDVNPAWLVDPYPWLQPEIDPIPFNPDIDPDSLIDPLPWTEVEPIPFNPDTDPVWPIDPLPWTEPEIDPVPFEPEIDPVWPWDPVPFPIDETPSGPRNEYPSCGGFRIDPPACPEGSYCATDTRDPWAHLIADLPGICISRDAKFCGGYAALECPEGLACYDYPSDNCNPRTGGAGCIGICL